MTEIDLVQGATNRPNATVHHVRRRDHVAARFGLNDGLLAKQTDVYTPIRIDDGVNVVRYQGPDALLASGYIWDENRRQLAYKPFVVSQSQGAGEVITFTQDPTVRAYLDGLNVILMNAIFRGSAHARPSR